MGTESYLVGQKATFDAHITVNFSVYSPSVFFMKLIGTWPDDKSAYPKNYRTSDFSRTNSLPEIHIDIHQGLPFVVTGCRCIPSDIFNGIWLHRSKGENEDIADADSEQQQIILVMHSINSQDELVKTSKDENGQIDRHDV